MQILACHLGYFNQQIRFMPRKLMQTGSVLKGEFTVQSLVLSVVILISAAYIMIVVWVCGHGL